MGEAVKMKKVFISTSSFARWDESPLRLLKEAGLDAALNPHSRKLSREEIVGLAVGANGLIAGNEPLDADVLKELKSLKVISRCGVGLDNVDLEAAKTMGIKVFNTPYGPTLAVAELTVGLIINLLRNVTQMDREVRGGIWKKRMGYLLTDKTVGIIGFGRIGKKVAELLCSFGVKMIFCDPAIDGDQMDCRKRELSDILKESDIICLHISSLPPENNPLLGHKEIMAMKKGAFLVNCSRGGIVDEKALYEALQEGHLSGAAIDVFFQEPYQGKLQGLQNVILTPHVGSYAKEARVEMEKKAAKNLLKGLREVGFI